MTERERANRKRYAARLARIDREVEAFKRTAKIVPTRHRSECYEGAEYADLKKKGLTLRVEKIKPDFREKDLWGRDIPQRLCHSWFYTRPGRRALALHVGGETPKAAREVARLMDADMKTQTCAYIWKTMAAENATITTTRTCFRN